jgi:hypothetical protein
MLKAIVIVIAILAGVALCSRPDRPVTPAVPPPTPEERAEAAKQQKEFDNNAAITAAALSAKFTAERAGIIAQAKKLMASRKYREAIDLGDSYLWAHDTELETIVGPARVKQVDAAIAKDRAERKKQGAAELLSAAIGTKFDDAAPVITFAVVSKAFDTLRDPHSMEIVESLVIVNPDLLTGCLTFRAKNGFGGYNVNRAVWAFSDRRSSVRSRAASPLEQTVRAQGCQ